MVKHVRADSHSRRDQWSNNNHVQLPLFLDFKCQFLIFILFSVIVAYIVYCYIIITVIIIINIPFFHLYTYQGEGTGVISKKQILKH